MRVTLPYFLQRCKRCVESGGAARKPGRLLTQRRLLAEVWEPAPGNLRLYVGQLRTKLEPEPARPRHLLTEPGMGYRFQP